MESKVLVLFYHKVSDIQHDWNSLAVSVKEFEEQMLYVKEHYQIIRAEDDFGKEKGNIVVITFDDGYEDNLVNALPILEKYEIPATIFVTTGLVGSDRELWHDEIVNLIFMGRYYPDFFITKSTVCSFSCSTRTIDERVKLYYLLRNMLLRISNAERELILDDLREWAGPGQNHRTTHRMLSLEQLRKLSNSNYITIGAHTINHPSLGLLEKEEQWKEIAESKKMLEEWINQKISLFSYPFGNQIAYTNETIAICKTAGFTRAMTTKPGIIKNNQYSEYEIPRVVVQTHNLNQFKALLNGYFNEKHVLQQIRYHEEYLFEYIGEQEQDVNLLKSEKEIVIFGAGYRGKQILDMFVQFGIKERVRAFLDNDYKKINSKIDNIPVYHPRDISKYKDTIIVLALKNITTVLNQIEELGLKKIHYYF